MLGVGSRQRRYLYHRKTLSIRGHSGFLLRLPWHHAQGINLDTLKLIKETKRQSLSEYVEHHPEAVYIDTQSYPRDGHAVWRFKAHLAFPCATQNEFTEADAETMLANGIFCISEGSNMSSTANAVDRFLHAEIAYGPGKAANAGGVATSQLEMAQNSSMQQWSMEKVDTKLQMIMRDIYKRCSTTSEEFGQPYNLVLGANIAGFRRVADAMIEQGVV